MLKNNFEDDFFKVINFFLLFVGVSFYVVFLSSNYANFGTEGILINGLSRWFEGISYASSFDSVPLALSTYSPVFYILYYPLGVIFPEMDTSQLIFFVRILNPIFYSCYSYFIYRLLKEKFKGDSSKNFFLLAINFFIFREFLDLFCFKPDMHSFFIEIIALLVGLEGMRLCLRKKIAFSGALFGIAFLLKANTIGFGVGLVLTLLCSKRWKDFFVFSLSGMLITTLCFVALYFSLGSSTVLAVLETTKSDFLPYTAVFEVFDRVLSRVVFPYLIIFVLFFLGVRNEKIFSQQESRAILVGFVISFLLASVAQFKYGAYINYYYGLILVALVICPLGFSQLKNSEQFKKILTYTFLILVGLTAAQLLQLPGRTYANDLKNYDFKAMNSFIDQKFAHPRVYTENNNGAVHLGKRAYTGVALFSFMNATSSINARQGQFRELFQAGGGFNAVVSLGSGCEEFIPDPRFSEILLHLRKLIYKKGKICIFSKGQESEGE